MYNNIFKITHNDVLPAQGSILISEPFLQDAYFQRSVVLLVEHTQEGSMGFVLNKKTELSVNTFFADLQGFPEMPIYLGGPVSANRLFFIHSLGDLIIPNSLKINDHLYFDPHHRRAGVGILVDPLYQKNGLATEALELLAEYAFSYLKLHQLFVHIPIGNEPSKALFARCGFTVTGILTDWITTKDNS